MNKKQKIVVMIAIELIFVTFLVWLISGGDIFTKTQVLIETKDELFGWTEKKWVNKFVLGLDLTLLISGIITIVSIVFIYLFRNKN
ncbi:hypothetical protein [Rosettibacter firmus]|uniref:hypothetical protein n=1 Tax=Rosettibacter firmus TaxID=3111522 RepID=UPI00336C1835